MLENIVLFINDLRAGIRALSHSKGVVATIVVTLALGIGANAAMFSLLRAVLLRPLVNRDEASLIYISQISDTENLRFSIPEIQAFRTRLKSFHQFGDFSSLPFTMVGLGEPRSVKAG